MRAVELRPTWILLDRTTPETGAVCWPRDNSGQLGPGGLNRWGETSKRAKCPPFRRAVYARGPAADGSGLCAFAGAPYGGSGSALRFVGVGCAQVRSGRGGPGGHGRGCWFRCGSELRPVGHPEAGGRGSAPGAVGGDLRPGLSSATLGVQAGWRCLEVDAGRGSMAVWLAERVGPSGGVVATDIDVSYLERLDAHNLEVRRHNILKDSLDALEPGSFDAVRSRPMLFHLVGRQEQALRQMMLCLKPGGVDRRGCRLGHDRSRRPLPPALCWFSPRVAEGDWGASREDDPRFGRTLPALFERSGLENTNHKASTEVVRGGSPWARWYRESLDLIAEATGGQSADKDASTRSSHQRSPIRRSGS
jgi:SAM-dependent methyltransferase